MYSGSQDTSAYSHMAFVARKVIEYASKTTTCLLSNSDQHFTAIKKKNAFRVEAGLLEKHTDPASWRVKAGSTLNVFCGFLLVPPSALPLLSLSMPSCSHCSVITILLLFAHRTTVLPAGGTNMLRGRRFPLFFFFRKGGGKNFPSLPRNAGKKPPAQEK